jgi:alpha-beta hydrolase superfamily lysophospholipase
MTKLTLKEKFAFRFIFNEQRVYRRWYGRFLVFGIDYGRLRRVVARVDNWLEWCREWAKEGSELEQKARSAQEKGNATSAVALFHEAVACYHIGQHIFFIDPEQKESTQEKARQCYRQAISMYPTDQAPVRIEIPFDGAVIPGYLHRASGPDRPLIVYVNGMDNIKEAENHFFGRRLVDAGFNFFAFDGPGQGEMWRSMKFTVDYHPVVSAIIDWFEAHNNHRLDLERVATVGFSLGGYLAPVCAAHDRRVSCAVGNSGFARIGGLAGAKKLNPIWQRGVSYMTGCEDFEEAVRRFDLDITRAPSLDRPLLFFHAGRDEVMPEPKQQADAFMEWASGEKELVYYPDAEHCTVDYLDEVFPYIVDWLQRHLRSPGGER